MTPDKAVWTTALSFDDAEAFETSFEGAETFNTTMDQVVEVTTSDHRKLTHRDAAEQHPIGAITALEPELGVRPSSALTNSEIQDILGL